MGDEGSVVRGFGLVEGRVINRGSKSERVAIEVESDGGKLRLVRPKGNPFHDPVLHRLIGAVIDYEGRIVDGALVLDKWRRRPS